MSTELYYLGWVALLTAFLWIPYVADRAVQWGIKDTVSYPESPPPLSPWAERAQRAHYNAVENLVVFATLVLVVQLAGLSNDWTAAAAVIYLWARVFHYIVYLFAFPWARTIFFVIGWACQLTLAWQIVFHYA